MSKLTTCVTTTIPQQRISEVEPLRELDRVTIRDNGEPLVDVRERVPGIGITNVPGPIEAGPSRYHARATVAAMLERAQAALPAGHRLLVMSIYRSLDEQVELYERVMADLQAAHANWPKNVLVRETNRWVHPPHAKTPPGHSTGGAVDVIIGGPGGEPLDFTSPLPFKYEGELDKFSPTFSPHVDETACANRNLLIQVMTESGFTNYPGEFWHWSYGDSCWAWRIGRTTALYGPAPPPRSDGPSTSST